MIDDIGQPNNPRNGKALVGIILLVLGAVLLVRQFTFFFIPHWLFSGPMWLVFIGLIIGARSNFHKPSSFILITLGVFLLINNNVPGASGIVWPLGIIAFGLWMILRRHNRFDTDLFKKQHGQKWDWRNYTAPNQNGPGTDDSSYAVPPKGPQSFGPTGDDYLDTVSVFGGVKKTILSKDFKGGEIVNIFGGAEVDFSQADIRGRVVVDISQIFGGTKIIVPSHWQVVSDIAAVFAGIDDKRMRTTATANSEKILVLTGFSVFAGVDIRSY